jgi:predicted RNA-binding protein with EMAP domain
MKCIYCGSRTDGHAPHCTVKLLAENIDLRERLKGTWNQKDLLAMIRDKDKEIQRLKDAYLGGQNDLCSDS